jgi:hypothetical protein
MMTVVGQQRRAFAHFWHPAVRPATPGMNDTTRRLCAAMFIDDNMAQQVIEETTDDEFRAVPPSIGFDLGPVVRHAFRARRFLIWRDALLTALLLLGLFLVPAATMSWILIANGIWHWRRGGWVTRHGRGLSSIHMILLGIILFLCAGFVSPLLLFVQDENSAYSGYEQGDASDLSNQIASVYNNALLGMVLLLPLLFAAATFVVVLGSRLVRFRTLTHTLAPAANGSTNTHPIPEAPNERIARRLHWIDSAQYGNVSLHSKNPFMGLGNEVTIWSMALALQDDPAGRHNGGTSRGAASTSSQRVSPSELLHHVRQGILGLSDSSLPSRQHVPGVHLLDRVVADGERDSRDPLIDPHNRTPLEMASTEAMGAIIEHPQGGVRYYVHVLVGAEGREITGPDGRQVLPRQNQDIAVSALVHVAIEGGKLYLEFIGMVLPPVHARFRVVDKLRPDLSVILRHAVPGMHREWLATVASPMRFTRALRHTVLVGLRARAARDDAAALRTYDHGARMSVRELAAEPAPSTFLQELDAFKYVKLIEKSVLGAVLDYLEGKGIDTSEYQARMTVVQDNQINFNNSTFHGPTAIGPNSTASQTRRADT